MTAERYDVEEAFLSIGRTFAEYARMFDLDGEVLQDREIIDCGGGSGSFTATAAALSADATAVDPMYGPPAEALEPGLAAAVDRTSEQLRDKQDLFVWDEYRDVETRARYLCAAYHRFLADYANHPCRYVNGALPDLPVGDNAADLVLSANLCFLYDDRLDLDFHLAAMRDLVRVAREEVRVFPLTSLDSTRSEYVDPVVDALRGDGLTAEVEAVPYEFQRGSSSMLVISGIENR